MKRTHFKKTPKRLLAVCLGLLFAIHGVAEQFVELTVKLETDDWSYRFFNDEQLESHGHGENHSSILAHPRTLRCVVGTNSWLIESEAGGMIVNAKCTYWFTGSNIVMHSVVTAIPGAKGQPSQGLPHGDYLPIGTRSTRIWKSTDGNPGRPVREADVMHPLGKACWLAFCSGSFLKQEGCRVPLPDDIWKEYLSPTNGFPDVTTTFKDDLGLPRSVEQFANTNQTIFQYRVHQSTNVLGWNFPLEFYWVQYNPKMVQDHKSNTPYGWEVDVTGKGKVTSIGPGIKPEIPADVFKYVNR